MKKLLLVLVLGITGCSTDPIQGSWDAKWETDPAGYGEMAADMSFEMDGLFTFNGNKVTVAAFGYEKCIFGVDTLEHTLGWKINGDTLEFQNQPGEPGIQYKILERDASNMRLQLVDDIFITLTK